MGEHKMDDLNFLHTTYEGKAQKSAKVQTDELEEFGLNPKIVIVEDDRILGLSIKKYLMRTLNCDVVLFSGAEECLSSLLNLENKSTPFCLITDISLEHGADGLLLIDNLKEKKLNFVFIAMTGFASIETAIAATKKGVFHYLTKPFELESLQKLVMEAISTKLGVSHGLLKSKNSASLGLEPIISNTLNNIKMEMPTEEDFFCEMIGRSKVMKEVFTRIEKVSLTESTILISGASGTGKELVASAIHNLSSRRHEQKVSVNCGAIPRDLLESELFGHTKGSFTGAISDRKGRFESAHKGSIFLDEIGDMPHLLQVKLLRVLQNKSIEPVGSNKPIIIDTRVIAATHRNLEMMVEENSFREDLFYRLNVIPIKVPSLKERREDIPLLMSYFIKRFISADESNIIHFSDAAFELMLSYDWPGNVRELENIIERLVILRGGSEILPEDLPAKIFRHNPLSTKHYKSIFELPQNGINLKEVLSEIEDSLIIQALGYTKGNKNQASKLLNLNRTTLIEKMKKRSLN